MKADFCRRQQGFTLVELLVGLALTAMLLAGAMTVLSANIRVWMEGRAGVEVQQAARYAVSVMARELSYGDTYTLQASGADISFRDIRSNATVRYFLSGGKLFRETGGSPQPVTGDNALSANVVISAPSGETLFSQRAGNTYAVYIALTATDTVTNQTVTLRTAVTGLSQYIK